MIGKRLFDLVIAVLLLILLSPFMIVVAVWIKLDSDGPAIYRQERIGRRGVPFDILKFRTMTESGSGDDLLITTTTNSRITRCGTTLRRMKIDELPQLMNVLIGHMSLVGPRPEVKKYVDMYPDVARAKIFSVRPGITDNAAISFRNESELLTAAEDPEAEYIGNILPAKVAMYVDYVENRSFIGDIILIVRTLLSVVFGRSNR